jgi:hypothetical protein
LTEESRYADEIQQARGGGIEMPGELGDLVTQAVEFGEWNVGRVDIHGEPPSNEVTLPRGFGATWVAHQRRDRVVNAVLQNREPIVTSRSL